MQKNILPRYYQIDLLKIFSMILIIILHILGQGGVLNHSQGLNHYLGLFLQIIALPSVNCFGLISGYLGYTDLDKPFNFSKYLSLWLQVFTYSFTITLLAFILNPKLIDFKLLIFSLFPVLTKNYWYFSAYTVLFLFMPYINKTIRKCDEKEAKKIIIGIFFIFSLFSLFTMKFDPFTLNKGYSFLWLFFLYIIGALFKKYSMLEKIKLSTYLYMYIISIILTLINVVMTNNVFKGILTFYNSFTILLMAIVMLGLCLKLNFKSFVIKIINFFHPTTFGIYILHIHTIVWIYLLKDRFFFIANLPFILIPFAVIFYAINIFLFCAIIEKLRIYIFKSLNIHKLIKNITLILNKLLDKIILIFDKL